MTRFVDFNLHNLFSIRLVDPTPAVVKAVKNQVGVPSTFLDGEPDLTISYVDRLPTAIYHTEMGSAGFTEDSFFVVSIKGRMDYRAQFPFADLGRPCKMICETGMEEIPLLKLVINLRMLAKGLMPMHASAFVFDGAGVVVNGWPKGGKTSTLFAFLEHGARFISDDWLFVDPNCKIYGLMQPIKLSDWQLHQLPGVYSKVKRSRRWIFAGLSWLEAVEQRLPVKVRDGFLPARAFHTGLLYLNKKQRHITLSPEKLLDNTSGASTGKLDLLLMTLSHESPEVKVIPLDEETALDRLTAALHYEWIKWEEYYDQYLYAFPDKRNMLMDSVWEKQRSLLKHLLAGKSIFQVSHPHPVRLDELYQAVSQTMVQFKGVGEGHGVSEKI